MKTKITGSANEANAWRTGATRRMIASTGPSMRGDRQRQRLGDPEHDHHRQDAGQAVRGRRDRQRRRDQRDEEQRPEEQADRAAPVVELLLGRRVGLDGLERLMKRAHRALLPSTRRRARRAPSRSGTRRRRVHSTRCVPPGATTSSVAAGAAVRRGRHRRRRRAGARRRGRADAALPDQDAHAIRRLDLGELDVGAGRKRARAWPAPARDG